MARYVRFKSTDGVFYGRLEGDVIYALTACPFGDHKENGKSYALGDVSLLTPTEPSKMMAVGFNYRDHAIEFHKEIPTEPNIFIKPNSCMAADGDVVLYPKELTKQVEYEAELVIVIGKTARYVSEADAMEYVFGFTIGNDVTARDLQHPDNQWGICKGFDTFGPFGPWIETGIDGSCQDICSVVNGQIKQHSNTKHLIFTVPYLVSYLSKAMTLNPGDIIFTGTPAGVGPVKPGDVMEMRIEGIGTLTNKVAE
ncbi:MAG: fumarylacetoacetate hydrolase family protein [Angelakisella sp.]|nr:fumarylacetoacetate hydrolase family protein [Angelakisella sp.]